MPHHHDYIEVEGRIGDVFFHRFVVELNTGGKILADVGPKGAESFPLEPGTEIVAEGEMKPSELKVARIALKGGTPIEIGHGKPHHGPHDHHEPADPAVAQKAVKDSGLEPVGAPRRKPRHFEVLGRKGIRLFECHVELDGHIRKQKPVMPDEPKWANEIDAIA